jgi:hypothetical protein
MLKMKGDLDELLKIKGWRRWKTGDLDEYLKTNGLCDNRSEPRRLLKEKELIALLAIESETQRPEGQRDVEKPRYY